MQTIPALISSVLALLRNAPRLRAPHWWQSLPQDRRHWILGLSFITLAAVIWVVASFVVQEVEAEGLHPFLLSYIANSLFIVYLPAHWLASKAWSPRRRNETDAEEVPSAAETGRLQRQDTQSTENESRSLVDGDLPAEVARPQPGFWGPFLNKQVFKAAAVVAPLWFLAQFTFNASLNLTSVTSNTILSSASSLFTYALSCAFRLEQLALRKLLFILLCIAGVGLVAFVDEHSGDAKSARNSLSGDLLCLVSSCFYAAYTIAIRVMLEDDEHASMMLFFGFVGLLNLVCLAPVLGALWAAAVVHVGQLTARMFALTVGKGLFDNALSDYLWARAVLLIGPTVATLGLSLQLPIATAADVALHSPNWLHNNTWPLMLLGAFLILIGFFGINLDNLGWPWPCSAASKADS